MHLCVCVCVCVCVSHVHGGVDLSHGLVVQGELVDLDPVADQLAHDLDLELVQLTLADGVRLGDDGDDVDLQWGGGRCYYCYSLLIIDTSFVSLAVPSIPRSLTGVAVNTQNGWPLTL